MTVEKWMYAYFDKMTEFWGITLDGKWVKMLINP